jgi:hypothetical protein
MRKLIWALVLAAASLAVTAAPVFAGDGWSCC